MSVNLYNAKRGFAYKVETVPDIGLLNSLGVRSNAVIRIKNKYSMGGPVLLQIDTCSVALGKDIALQIMVQEVQG